MSICSCFFFIDACGSEVVANQPAWDDFADNQKALRSVFGYSSACVPSILSGTYPEDHLHWSYFTHGHSAPLRSPWWMKCIPSSLRDRGRVRAKLSPYVKRHNNIHGYFQLYQMPLDVMHHYGHCEPNDIFTPGGLNQGRTIIDELHHSGVTHWVSDWHKDEATNWQHMKKAACLSDNSFLFMYAASLDGWLHDHTREHPDLGKQLEAIRRNIDTVLDKAKAHHDEVRFYVFSDHGMCTSTNVVNPFIPLDPLPLRMHEDYHCIIDSTMVRCWFNDDKQEEIVSDALSSIPSLKKIDRNYLIKERCNFPDNRFGNAFWLADPHTLLAPSHMGKKPLAAMHGYDCDHVDSNASFSSNIMDAQPDTIVDLHALMINDLELLKQAN
jgi:hypothetical protein